MLFDLDWFGLNLDLGTNWLTASYALIKAFQHSSFLAVSITELILKMLNNILQTLISAADHHVLVQ